MPDYLKIGDYAGGVAGLDTLDSLGIKSFSIDIESAHYTEYIELGDGTVQAQGWLEAEWHLNGVRDAAYTLLVAYRTGQSTELYIRTVSEDGKTLKNYKAVMVWPEGPIVRDHTTNVVLDFTIRFIQMIEQV